MIRRLPPVTVPAGGYTRQRTGGVAARASVVGRAASVGLGGAWVIGPPPAVVTGGTGGAGAGGAGAGAASVAGVVVAVVGPLAAVAGVVWAVPEVPAPAVAIGTAAVPETGVVVGVVAEAGGCPAVAEGYGTSNMANSSCSLS